MIRSNLSKFVLCGAALATLSAQASILDHKWACLGVAGAAAYYVYKTEPARAENRSLEALKNNPLQWLEDAIGNRQIPATIIALPTDDNPEAIIENGQKPRGILGMVSVYGEDIKTIVCIFATIQAFTGEINGFCGKIGFTQEIKV